MGAPVEMNEGSARWRADDEPPMNERRGRGTKFLQAQIVPCFVRDGIKR
jgi:hypothetical protein